MEWRRQGPAILKTVQLKDGRRGFVVLIGNCEKEKNAVIVFQKGEEREIISIQNLLDFIKPEDLVDILCVQERFFEIGLWFLLK
jgi:hypothetical protein